MVKTPDHELARKGSAWMVGLLVLFGILLDLAYPLGQLLETVLVVCILLLEF